MAKAGDIVENPITGKRITFLKTSQETNGNLLRIEYVLPPGFTISERTEALLDGDHDEAPVTYHLSAILPYSPKRLEGRFSEVAPRIHRKFIAAC